MAEADLGELEPFYAHLRNTLMDGKDHSARSYFKLTRELQRQFDSLTLIKCRGLNHHDKGKEKLQRYCNNPLCPCCWNRKNAAIFKLLTGLQGWPYYYLRQTWFVPWWEDLHPRCVQRFKSYHSAYRLAAYTMNFDAPGAVIDEDSAKDEWRGELSYQLRGVFVSDHLVHDKRTDPNLPGQIEVFLDPRHESGDSVGIIDRAVFTSQEGLLDAWLHGAPDNTDMPALMHPMYYREHPVFDRYIRRFMSYNPAGRSWAKLKSLGVYHGKEEGAQEEKEGGQEEKGQEGAEDRT